jgi:sodium/hydrogen antiporter
MPILASDAGALGLDLAILGGLLAIGGLLAGLARRSFLSLTALFVLLGFGLGPGGLGLIEFDPRSGFVATLAIVALIVLLFRDGLEVEKEMLQTAWHLPLRKLVLAMPLTAALVAVAAKAITDLSWGEAFLLGALLAPTDPVLSSSVVTNPRVPRLVRHSLNLESGLNDGLALPAVLIFTAALTGDPDFELWRFIALDVPLGVVTGLVVGYAAARLFPRGQGLGRGPTVHQKALFALGVAFLAYGAAVLQPAANGFISVFVCSITLGILRADIRESFERRSEELVEVVKLGIFVVFGALLTLPLLLSEGWAAVAIVVFLLVVARPVAVFLALAGTDTDAATRGFMAWFGPKGVATMTFSLLVLGELGSAAEPIFSIAALAVFCSVLVHGLTDTPGAQWLARREQRRRESAPLAPGAPAPTGPRAPA